jgi:hypothetical protein
MYLQVYQKQLESNFMVPRAPNTKSEIESVEDREMYLVKVLCSRIPKTIS